MLAAEQSRLALRLVGNRLPQLALTLDQRGVNSLVDLGASLLQHFKERAGAEALAHLQGGDVEPLRRALFVQPHQNVNIELVIFLHRGEEGSAQPLAQDLCPQRLDRGERLIKVSGSFNEIASVTFDDSDVI